MAKIGSIYLGGRDFPECAPEHFPCGIAFPLKGKSELSQVWASDDPNWQVEIKQGHEYVVAQSHKAIELEDLVATGLEEIQRCLDVTAVKKKGTLSVHQPEAENIAVFRKNGDYVLRHFCMRPLEVEVSVSIEHRDKLGNIVPPTPIPEPTWTWAFRYYRLSQNSQDIFEAYRNLYLSFEALLNEICPKQSSEGERKRLKTTLSTITSRVNLSSHVPNSDDEPTEYLVRTQYDDVRCPLFHAKFPGALLPYAELNPTDVVIAYEALLRLWRSIAEAYFNVPRGGVAFTHQGFKHHMDGVFSKPLSLHFTEDNSPSRREDTAISPRSMATFQFPTSSYLGETNPGLVSWTAELALSEGLKGLTVRRICTTVGSKLWRVTLISDGLSLTGVDVFETYQSARLVNNSQPKTIF